MYKNVLWATDGSEAAGRALPHAKAFAAEGGGKLTVTTHASGPDLGCRFRPASRRSYV
jgi:nucleotide-binding universal stress UspA family protein